MARYELTNEAVEDLTKVWDYTFDKWSENKLTSIMKCCLKIANILQTTQTSEKIMMELKTNYSD